jgi:biotin synthase
MMNYTLEQVRNLYNLPITTLIYKAQQEHHRCQDPAGVQLSTLLSIKTGGCGENCGYCSQSVHHNTDLKQEPLMDSELILQEAKKAKKSGASRFCMGTSGKRVDKEKEFESILNTIHEVSKLGLEVCCTLGLVSFDQAERLKEAGCSVYNHNLDTSRDFYSKVVTTRTYDDRLKTIKNVRNAGLDLCSGGILGLGETIDDRLKMLVELANMTPPPESVPINAIVPIKNTPMQDQPPVDSFEFVRIIAVTRIIMPTTMVRLSAGRNTMSEEMQTLCYVAGANSIFLGKKLLTTENFQENADFELLNRLNLHPLDPKSAKKYHRAALEAEHSDCKE